MATLLADYTQVHYENSYATDYVELEISETDFEVHENKYCETKFKDLLNHNVLVNNTATSNQLSVQLQSVNLPKISLPKLSGSYTDWNTFKA